MVTAEACSGFKHNEMKSCCNARMARYSFKYLPACRIIQTGVCSDFLPLKVVSKSFSVIYISKLLYLKKVVVFVVAVCNHILVLIQKLFSNLSTGR